VVAAEVDASFAVSFAVDGDDPLVEVEVAWRNTGEFADPDAGGKEDFDEEPRGESRGAVGVGSFGVAKEPGGLVACVLFGRGA
jgi:hypothetical protein